MGALLGISEANARVAAFRMRRRLRRILREEVALTVGSTDEVDDEIDQLFLVFGSPTETLRKFV